MGIFDRFKKKKENIPNEAPAETPVTPAEAPAETVTPAEPPVPAAPDEKAIRSLAIRFVPKGAGSPETHQKMMDALGQLIRDFPKEDMAESVRMLWEGKGAEQASAVVAQLAAGTAARLKGASILREQANTVPGEVLLRAWAALDLYGHACPDGKGLIAMRDEITPVLTERKILSVRPSTPMEKLLFRCAQLEKDKAPAEEIREVRRQIWQELKQQEEILIAFDEDYNPKFPYVGIDGAACIFLQANIGNVIRLRNAEHGDGHFALRKLGKEQLDTFAASLLATGIPAIRVFLAAGICLLPVHEIVENAQKSLPDRENRFLRGQAICTLQFNARLNKLNASLKGSEKHKQLTAAMLSARANLCRELGNHLVYVLGPAPFTPGVTLYTPEALKLARVQMEKTALPEESLIAPGDRSIALYEGKLALRAMNLPGQAGLDTSYVCVFTQRDVCETARQHYLKSGAGDSVIVLTWDELCAQAESCAGIVLDQGALSMIVPKAWFADVARFRTAPGPIRVNLKDNPPEAKA